MKIKNNTPASETEESGITARREKTGSVLFAVLLILMLVFAMGYATIKQFEKERDAAYTSLHNSMYSLRNLISFESNLEDAFVNIRDAETVMYGELAEPFFDYLGVSVDTLNACKYNWDADAIYYFSDDGSTLTTDNAAPFSLDKSQTRMLKTVGILFQNEWVYNAARLQDGWVFIKWTQYPNIYNVDFQRIAEAVPSSLCIIENATGNILISSDKKPYDFLDESLVTYDEERNSSATDGIQAGYLKGDSLFSGIFFEKSRLLNRYSVFVYVPFETILNDTLDKTLAVHALLIVIFVYIWICSRKIRKSGLALPAVFASQKV